MKVKSKWTTHLPVITVLILLSLVPGFLSNYIISFLVVTLMYVVMASSWNIFCGFTGYISLGHGMFFGAGAYAFALAMVKCGWPYYTSIVLAAAVCGVVAFFIASILLTVRIRVPYFAMITLGFNAIFQTICANSVLLGESYGFTIPPSLHLYIPYYILLGTAVVLISATFLLETSHIGLALKSIFQDEEAAETTGIDVNRLKVTFFVVSGVFSGVAGAVMAWFWSYIDPYMAFNLVFSFQVAIMVILGGSGTVFGPAIAACLMSLFIEILSASIPHFHNIIFGVLVTVMIIISPKGMNDLINRLYHGLKRN